MTEFLKHFVGPNGASRDEVLRILTRVIEIGVDFKGRDRFFDPSAARELREVMNEPLPLEATEIDAVLDDLEKRYLPGITNFGSRRFLGFPDSGNSVAGIAGAILADLVNVNLINSTFCARLATEMEIAVIRWMRQVVGYEDTPSPNSAVEVGGAVLAGGTMANFMAILLARERAFPGTLQNGITFDTSKVRIVIPERVGHYTMPASLSWSGLGSSNVVRCPITEFRYDKNALRTILHELKESGTKVIMLCAYAGDSRTMAIEDLAGLHDFVRGVDPEIWLHCDGCHGTSLCFSDSHRKKVHGMELWDSISFDPHKVLTLPYSLSMLLLRDPASSTCVVTESDLIMRQRRSLGQLTPVLGSKAFWSLRLWMLFKVLGRRGIGQMIDERIANAESFAEAVGHHERFVVLNHTDINSVMFVYLPPELQLPLSSVAAQQVSRLNRAIYDRLLSEGEFYVHSFVATDNLDRLGQGPEFGVNVLRFMAGNPLVAHATFDELLSYVSELGEAIWPSLPQTSDDGYKWP